MGNFHLLLLLRLLLLLFLLLLQARVSAVTDEVVAAAAGGVAASSRFKSEQAKLKARLAERKARLAAMRVQDGSAAPPLPPADAAGVAGAADAAVDCDDDAEEAVESYAAAAVSFPAIRGHAPAVSLPLQWIVDKSFASSDIKSTYSKGGAGAGSQEARVPLAVGDKVVRYIGRKYGTAANWQAGTVVSIGLALPSSGTLTCSCFDVLYCLMTIAAVFAHVYTHMCYAFLLCRCSRKCDRCTVATNCERKAERPCAAVAWRHHAS